MKAIGYVRVSLEKQVKARAVGSSLEAQQAKIEAYCQLHDLELVRVEVESGESAATLERPALKRTMTALRRGEATALVVVKIDRLTRSAGDLETLVAFFKSGKRSLHSVTEHVDTSSSSGRGVLMLMAAVGGIERDSIGERTKSALAHKRERLQWVGGRVEYGWQLEVDPDRSGPHTYYRMVPEENERSVIARVRELRGDGLSLVAISATLEDRGILARNGRPFAPQTLARILTRTPIRDREVTN